MIASSTRSPRERMRAPNEIRSKYLVLASMMTSGVESVRGTAAATTIHTHPPAKTYQANDHHNHKGNEKFQLELIDRIFDNPRLVHDFGEADLGGQICLQPLLLSLKRLA